MTSIRDKYILRIWTYHATPCDIYPDMSITIKKFPILIEPQIWRVARNWNEIFACLCIICDVNSVSRRNWMYALYLNPYTYNVPRIIEGEGSQKVSRYKRSTMIVLSPCHPRTLPHSAYIGAWVIKINRIVEKGRRETVAKYRVLYICRLWYTIDVAADTLTKVYAWVSRTRDDFAAGLLRVALSFHSNGGRMSAAFRRYSTFLTSLSRFIALYILEVHSTYGITVHASGVNHHHHHLVPNYSAPGEHRARTTNKLVIRSTSD